MLCFKKTTGACSSSPFLHIFKKPLSRYLQAPQEVLKMSNTISVLLFVLCKTSSNCCAVQYEHPVRFCCAACKLGHL